MSDELNSRADSKLKRLPVEIHCEIVERLAAPGVTQLDVIGWLKEKHFTACSPASFSRSLPFIRQRVKSHAREQIILAKMDERRATRKFSEAELFAWGQEQFAMMSIADEDPKAWAMIQKTARDKEQSNLDRQRFKRETCELFLKWFEDKRAKEIAAGGLSYSDKLKRLDQLMFPDDHAK